MLATTYDRERTAALSRLEALHGAVVAITAESEPARVLQAIADQARAVGGATYSALGCVEAWDQPFSPWVVSGVPEGMAAKIGHLPRPVGTLAIPARGGATLRVPDVREHGAFQGMPPNHPVITSLLAVPLAFEGASVGTLYLGNKRAGGGFSRDDERAVTVLAAFAAPAVARARLRVELDVERSRLAAVFEHAGHGIIFVDQKTRRMIANPAADRIAGVEHTGPIDDYPLRLEAPAGQPLAKEEWPIARALRGELVACTEVVVVRPSGERVPILQTSTPTFDADGTVAGAVAAFEDISALKEVERLREEFAAMVAHDLRSPVAGILMAVDQLLFRADGAAEVMVPVAALERIRRMATRQTDMVRDLLDASRIGAGRLQLALERVDTPVVVARLLEELEPGLGPHRARLHVDGAPEPILVDELRFTQVLTNLVENAAKYSPPGTGIDVSIASPRDQKPARVVIAVRDRGIGVPADELPRIFDRFFQTKRARAQKCGLGLGLFITKGLVEAQGGEVWVESTPDVGSTFYVAFPCAGRA